MIYFVSNTPTLLDAALPYKEATVSNVLAYFKGKKYVEVDTETSSLDFITGHVLLLQLGDRHNQFVIHPQVGLQNFKPLLEDGSKIKILHNVKFDYKFLKRQGIVLENVYDVMLVEMVLNMGKENVSYSLKSIAHNYLNVTIDKSEQTSFLTSTTFTPSQIVYAATDVAYLGKIRELQMERVRRLKLENVAELENKVSLAFADIEYNGISINRQAWLKIAENSKIAIAKQIKLLDALAIAEPRFELQGHYIQQSLFSTEDTRKTTVNWDSPKQVLRIFQKVEPSLEGVGKDAIFPVRKKHPLFEQYIQYQKYCKLYSSFGPKFLDAVQTDGRMHTQIRQIVDTGRVASSEPNMQQIPQLNEFRNCFIPNDPNNVFVSSDYSSQELCVIAYGSGDPVWLEALRLGQDLHSICADLVFGAKWKKAAEKDCLYFSSKQKCECPGHKKLRNSVKSINFGLAYGMSAMKLSDKEDIPVPEAERLIRKYFKTFPKIKKFLAFLGKTGTSNGYISTYPPFNRIRWFDDWSPTASYKVLGSIERKSKNTPIQGTSADMTKLALVLIRDHLQKTKSPVQLVMTVHDQIDTECPRELAAKWKKELTVLMETAAIRIIRNGLLKAETSTSTVWQK